MTVHLSAYTNTANLVFKIAAATNLYFLQVTNSPAGKSFVIEVQQGALWTVGFATNTVAGMAAWYPPAYGQLLTLSTNSTYCRQIISVQVDSTGTNALFNQVNFVR